MLAFDDTAEPAALAPFNFYLCVLFVKRLYPATLMFIISSRLCVVWAADGVSRLVRERSPSWQADYGEDISIFPPVCIRAILCRLPSLA